MYDSSASPLPTSTRPANSSISYHHHHDRVQRQEVPRAPHHRADPPDAHEHEEHAHGEGILDGCEETDLRSGQRVGHGEKASAARGEYEAEKGDDAVVPSENQAVLSEELVPGLLEVRVEHGVRGKACWEAFERKKNQ